MSKEKENSSIFKEIRFFSRGGQGGVTGAKLLAYAGMLEGYEVQSIPKYGAERKGAPITVDVRISDRPIRRHSPVTEPDHIIILEPTLTDKLPQTLKDDCNIIINASDLPKITFHENIRIAIVDAYQIADITGLTKSGTKLVSTIMLGAYAKITNGLVSLENVEKAIYKMFDGQIAEKNLQAIKIAFNEVQLINDVHVIESTS